ncbi:MAG: uracil-DNA glycosylase [Clostridia bacterium]|nr:uracil-DNA glycosylase [Clostridia bacterium]MBR6795209.1 uracil-DNA glycosylase [Clostridia bacterium]
MVSLGNDWDSILADEFQKDYYLQLRKFLKMEYSTRRIFPDMYDIFNALRYTAPESVKVVILGQDPYHGMGQAHGLCFSVKRGVKPPPSLQNIFKEIHDELHIAPPAHGELTSWAKQGVLLLNTVLTVIEGIPNSHKGRGWEKFTDRVIAHVNSFDRPIVYLLWGANARSKKALITNPRHLVLESPHPSPLSACSGFFGNGHFLSANRFLEKNGLLPIDWSLPN